MKKNFKVMPVFWIIVCVMLVFTGCTGQKPAASSTPEPATASSTPAPSGSATESSTPEVTQKPPITISVLSPTIALNVPSGIPTDTIAKEIERKFNVKLDVDFQPKPDKIAAMMASKSLPDLIAIEDPKIMDSLMQSGAILDLEPLLATNGPDILKNAAKDINFIKKFDSNGTNKLYYLNGQIGEIFANPDQGYFGPYFRWDYYKELGAPALNNDRDFVDLIAKMLQAHPTNEDGKKSLGLSLWSDWSGGMIGLSNLWGQYATGQATVGATDTSAAVTYNIFTDEIIDNYTADVSSLWNGLSFFNYAYRKNILDPESFTQKYENAAAKYNTAQPIASMASWLPAQGNIYLDKKGLVGKGYTHEDYPIGIKGSLTVRYNPTPVGVNKMWAISSNAKNPERIMDVLNYLYSTEGAYTLMNGVKDQDWTIGADGKYAFTAAHADRMKDPDAAGKYGLPYVYWNWSGLSFNSVSSETQQPFKIAPTDPKELAATRDSAVNDMMAFYKVNTSKELSELTYGPIQTIKSPLFTSVLAKDMPDDLKLIDTNIFSYMGKASLKIIKAKTDDEFNAQKAQIQAEVKKMGIDKVIAYWRAEAQKANDKLSTLN